MRITWTQPRPPLRIFHVVACHGQAATGTKAGTLVTSALTPTPTSPSFNYGNGGAAAGTYPTGWWWTHQITPNAVLSTLGSVSPSVSVTKTSAAGTVDVCYMGIQVEVGDMGGGWARYQKSADSTIWWGKRVFADTLFETADVNNPITSRAVTGRSTRTRRSLEGQDFPATLTSVADGGGVPTGYIPA
jgi:hypothetical protein